MADQKAPERLDTLPSVTVTGTRPTPDAPAAFDWSALPQSRPADVGFPARETRDVSLPSDAEIQVRYFDEVVPTPSGPVVGEIVEVPGLLDRAREALAPVASFFNRFSMNSYIGGAPATKPGRRAAPRPRRSPAPKPSRRQRPTRKPEPNPRPLIPSPEPNVEPRRITPAPLVPAPVPRPAPKPAPAPAPAPRQAPAPRRSPQPGAIPAPPLELAPGRVTPRPLTTPWSPPSWLNDPLVGLPGADPRRETWPGVFTVPRSSPFPRERPGFSPLPTPTPALSPRTVARPAPRVAPLPALSPAPGIGSPTVSLPRPVARPQPAPATTPLDLIQSGIGRLTALSPLPRPQQKPDRCGCEKKKRKPRKPRTVCYRGTYVELRNGLSKTRKEKVPCQ